MGGTPTIRAEARFGDDVVTVACGYLTKVRQKNALKMAGNFPFMGDLTDGFPVLAVEFLDPPHPVYALRPAGPAAGGGRLVLLLAQGLVRVPGGVYEVSS